MKKKVSVLSVVLYVLAGLLALYTIWAIVNVSQVISEAISVGSFIISGYEFDLVSYYMTNCAPYAVYAIVLAILGWILQKNMPQKETAPHIDVDYDAKDTEYTETEAAVEHFEEASEPKE
jgi:sugar phosphate permease